MLEASRRFSDVELWVQAVLRVPPCPDAPEGSPESVQVFRPGRNFYTLCLLVWFCSHFLILVGVIAAHLIVSGRFGGMPEWGRMMWRIVEWLGAFAFAASAAFTFISQRLNYYLRWYIVTDRSLRIRTGVLSIQELTMTFSNIQEIRVSAGPIKNFLKLADVEVQSAGGGSKVGGGHIARFQSVSNANAIRDLMVERLREYRDSGLGEPGTNMNPAPDHAIDAARAVLAEARALREQMVAVTGGN